MAGLKETVFLCLQTFFEFCDFSLRLIYGLLECEVLLDEDVELLLCLLELLLVLSGVLEGEDLLVPFTQVKFEVLHFLSEARHFFALGRC